MIGPTDTRVIISHSNQLSQQIAGSVDCGREWSFLKKKC